MLMIIIACFALLFSLFFFLKKPTGAAGLASIAGLFLYDSFKTIVADQLTKIITSVPRGLIEVALFASLIIIFPLFLHLFSRRGHLFKIARLIESLIFAAFLVLVGSWCITYFISVDPLSANILRTVSPFKHLIILAQAVLSYLNLLLYRDHTKD